MSSTLDFHLPSHLTIAHVHGLHEEFDTIVDKKDCDCLILHGENVQRVDTAGVQLLLALVLASKDRQISISWDHPSEKLETAASILGLNDALGIH